MEKQSSKPKKHRLFFIVLLLLLIGSLSLWRAPKASPIKISLPAAVTHHQPGLYDVIEVDDGDTIRVSQNGSTETVRFIGIDTPEVKDPRKPVQCYGPEASAHTHALLDGQKVRLEPDPLGDNRDKYHRLLRYVYTTDGTLVNESLVRQGYAFAYVIFPFTRLEDFKADERAAEAAGLGLWSHCGVDESTQIKQTVSP